MILVRHYSFFIFFVIIMPVVDMTPEFVIGAKIKIIGVGGAGNKAINRMIVEGLDGVDFIAINTDAQDLASNMAGKKLNIGLNSTKGLGAGAEPEVGRKAAEESAEDIKKMLQNTDMVFVTAGMGGGTGTGAAPVVASIAREMGILTVGIVTKPFSFEGKKREANAAEGLKRMKDAVDTLIVIPNDKIFTIADKKTTFKQAFIMIDKILYLGVSGMTELLVNNSDINIDFADVKAIMKNSGNALLGIGYGKGEKRAIDAARKAIENPLLETNLDGAKGVIFAVTGGDDLTPIEVQEAADVVREILDENVNMIWGLKIDPSYEDEVKVTIIATGFEQQSSEPVLKQIDRDILGRRRDEARDSSGFTKRDFSKESQDDFLDRIKDEPDRDRPAFERRSLQR
ncbi:MAG: cell division protein FtsZ [Candidatus Absconditabacterales bacterium]|nr:cell division protein FtsZ [Candidatus Absconditabacterales bacterium]